MKTWFWFRADCKLWSCHECAENRRRQFAARTGVGADKLIEQGLRVSHITLTAHRYWRSRDRSIQNFRANWPKLRKRIQRVEMIFAYAMFAEQHKVNSTMHVHVLATQTQKKRWWKDNAAECGLGHQVDVRAVEHGGEAAMYATKYISKSLDVLDWPKSFHRARFSQNWPEGKVSDFQSDVQWHVYLSPAHFDDEMRYWHEQGYKIVNTRTGEMSDA